MKVVFRARSMKRRAGDAVLAGMVGGALPDLDKPCRLFFGRSCFPQVIDRLHVRIQNEAQHRMPHEIAFGAAMVAWAASVVAGQ
jgi:hypothetical protein